MNNLKDFIVKNLIVIIIAAIIGGAIGSYLNYYFNNLSTEKRNEETTKQLMLFIHNEIYENYTYKFQGSNLLGVEGLDLVNLRESDFTIKDEQLAYLIKMYGHFRIFNFELNDLRRAQNSAAPTWLTKYMSNDVRNWKDICMQEIEEYEKEFCINKSLKSEIEVE